MRILIVTHAPLAPEYGAAQAASSLAVALRERGHEAVAWSTEPLPREARWWNRWRWQRRRLEEYLGSTAPFEAIDLPAVSASPRVAAHAPLVARSVQPDLRYFWCSLGAELAGLPRSAARLGPEAVFYLAVSAAILRGWGRARRILCLGGHERRWMHLRFPRLRSRLLAYDNAVASADRERLAGIRSRRTRPAGPGLRFLWIGRWVPQKGTRRLVRFLIERARERPHDRFTLAGCGDAARREVPPDLVASGRLEIRPGFSREELPELLATHDAGLFTSRVEGWGLSLNEMLESGMPVFATEAGAVEDLRPYFPRGLAAFPPPLATEWAPAEGDLGVRGYFARFTWEAIALRYEQEVLEPLAS